MIKVEDEGDQILIAKVYKAGQEQVFRFWSRLSADERRSLLDQLRRIDLQELTQLDRLRARMMDSTPHLESREPLRPPQVIPLDAPKEERARARARGEAALAAGEVAAFVVAGGQGTRLGWSAPKGTFPVGPATEKSLFQLFAEQIRAWRKRSGAAVPWTVLTSSGNTAETRSFFAEHACFGLPEEDVDFLVQSDLPTLNMRGKMLLAARDRLAVNPNGHGGALTALRDSGRLEELRSRGIQHLFYFQVDNPLCAVLDPVFLGYHIQGGAQVSTKVVAKRDPEEKVGVLAYRGNRLGIVEYSELLHRDRNKRDEDGQLRYRFGNIAVHAFRLDFLAELDGALPYHLAHKKVKIVDKAGRAERDEEPDALKFERFIFDVLGEARVHVALEVDRAEEFSPLKSQEGADTPQAARAALTARARRWLAAAGVDGPALKAERPIEISPLTALDPEELAARVAAGLTVPAGEEPASL